VLLSLLLAAAVATQTFDDQLNRAAATITRGEYRDALAQLESIAADTSLTPLQHARVLQLIASGRSFVGPDDRTLADADRAEAAARPLDAFDLLARIESVRGYVWSVRGQFLESLRHLKECLAWAEKAHQRTLVGGAYIRLGAAYQDMGDWTRALDAIDRSFEADPHPSDGSRLQYLTRRGLIEIELHEGDAAKKSMTEALEIARRTGDRRGEAQVLGDLSLAVQRIDRDPRAGAVFAAQAVEIARALKVPAMETTSLNQLGSLLREAGALRDARRDLQEAQAVIAASGERRDEPYVLKNLGQVLVGLGQIVEGERVLHEAMARADAASLTRVRWIARLELAQLDVRRNPAAADEAFQQALAIIEEQQTNVLLDGFRTGALNQTLIEYDPYDRYVSFLLDRGESARAFLVAERERARAFLDRLSSAREALADAVPAGFVDAENALLHRISASQSTLRAGGLTDSTRRGILSDIDAAESALTSLRLRLAAERPSLAHARYPQLWTAADLQSKLLAPDEHLVSYFLGADRSTCWIAGRDGLTTIALPPRAVLERLVRDALQALRDPAGPPDAAVAALSNALALDRVIAAAPGPRLVIVPHGILYDVPFEALAGRDGQPLVARYAISYAPSASSLAFFRSLAPLGPGSTTLLAVGNPIVRAPAAARTRQIDLARVDLLAPLPYSAEEVTGIASLFRPNVRVLEAADATETAIRTARLDGVRILHFATHGLIDESRPERSGLVLTAAPPSDDGLLQTREIYSLPLRAQLVTLSACQTALGQNVTGEGIIGLTRAFFYAGARSVVASLWDIEDASTARLMRTFYENLYRGEPIDVALQHAKLTFIRSGGATSRPFYWASFIVSGQARATIERPPFSVRRAAIIASAIVLAAAGIVGGGVAWRRRVRVTATARARTSGAATS
jgi:tetratricopeptide (TPR) repeat protein